VLRGLFVTGTDTGVGKTIAAAALLHRFRARLPGRQVRYWKPIQTGLEQDDDTAEVIRLTEAGPEEIVTPGVRLPRPLSPHLAARLAGDPINLDEVVHLVRAERGSARLIVEGAGGVLVPINDTALMADLMARLALPAVVVARTTLGTINHTLLTIEALHRRSIEVAGVIMIGEPNADNRDAIEHYGRVEVLGEMPRFEHLTARGLATWAASELDPAGHVFKRLS
jgi:dethiobiotin synthase